VSSKHFSLARSWQRIRTVPGLGRNVTALVVLILAGCVSMAGIVSYLPVSYPWEDTFEFSAEFEEVPGVNPKSSQSVQIAGVQVGKITGWKVTERGTAVLNMELQEGTPATIFENATAVLRTSTVLNNMYVEISEGGPPAKPLTEGGRIPLSQTRRPIQADQVLSHLDARTRQAVSDLVAESDAALAQAPEQLPAGLRATDKALVDLRPVVKQLQTRRTKIKKLVTAMSQISSAIGGNEKQALRLTAATQDALKVLAQNDRELRGTLEQMPGLSSELRGALTRTQALTKQLDPTLDNLDRASEELPPALDRFGKTVDELGTVVDSAAPVLNKARPVVADLRPLVSNIDQGLDDVLPITCNLDRDTRTLTRYLTPIRAFTYNTRSVFSPRDAQGGIIRGHVVAALPDNQLLPGGEPTRGAYVESQNWRTCR